MWCGTIRVISYGTLRDFEAATDWWLSIGVMTPARSSSERGRRGRHRQLVGP